MKIICSYEQLETSLTRNGKIRKVPAVLIAVRKCRVLSPDFVANIVSEFRGNS